MILLKGNYYRLRSRAKIKIDNPELTYCVGLFFFILERFIYQEESISKSPSPHPLKIHETHTQKTMSCMSVY